MYDLLTIANPYYMERQWTEPKNVAFITLPPHSKIAYLLRNGLKVGLDTYPNIHTGSVLIHESGVCAKVRGIKLIHRKYSAQTLVELKVTNNTCDKALFQSLFYDYVNVNPELVKEFFYTW